MDIETLYFDIQHAIHVHDRIIELSGGLHGYRAIGLLESVLDNIQNDMYYPSIAEKLTHLVFLVNKLHAFNDGNKRASISLGAYFLELNGYDYCVGEFMHRMENIAVWVAEGKIDKDLLGEMIATLIDGEDYNETLKLKIFDAVNSTEL